MDMELDCDDSMPMVVVPSEPIASWGENGSIDFCARWIRSDDIRDGRNGESKVAGYEFQRFQIFIMSFDIDWEDWEQLSF